MSAPYWNVPEGPWDKLVFAGKELPGFVVAPTKGEISQLAKPEKDGTIVLRQVEVPVIDFMLDCRGIDEYKAMQERLDSLFPKSSPAAVAVYHPLLQLLRLSSALNAKLSLTGPQQNDTLRVGLHLFCLRSDAKRYTAGRPDNITAPTVPFRPIDVGKAPPDLRDVVGKPAPKW
jgi:hypothetical protein